MYNNALALLFWPPFLLVGSEYSKLFEACTELMVRIAGGMLSGPCVKDCLGCTQKPRVASMVMASCVVGVGISFTGFGFRNLVTATTFTVVGVMNKVSATYELSSLEAPSCVNHLSALNR